MSNTEKPAVTAVEHSGEGNLKKTLGLKEVVTYTMGQTIGTGVMTMTGVAIGMAGYGVVPAYVLSSVIVILMCIPLMLLGSALPTNGGPYRYASVLWHPSAGLLYMLLYIPSNLTIALYAVSFADYMQSLIPGVPFKLCAVLFLTLMYVANLFGIEGAAKLQNLMVVIMCLAMAIFIVNGIPQVNFSQFTIQNMMPNGFLPIFTAASLLTFATGGGNVVVSLGGEMKNPGRDIPLGMALGTLPIGVLFALMGLVASGVLPIEQVAYQNLSLVAQQIMSTPLYLFFMVFGALFAIATTLNATFGWVTKPLLAACEDGWFPKKLGAVNKKYGTPHILLTLFYFVGLIPIMFDLSLASISALGSGISLFVTMIPVFSCYFMYDKFPEEATTAPFHLNRKAGKIITIIVGIFMFYMSATLMATLEKSIIYVGIAYTVIALVVSAIAYMKKKPVFYTGDAKKDFGA